MKQHFEGAAESHFYVPLTQGSIFFPIVQMKFADCHLKIACKSSEIILGFDLTESTHRLLARAQNYSIDISPAKFGNEQEFCFFFLATELTAWSEFSHSSVFPTV